MRVSKLDAHKKAVRYDSKWNGYATTQNFNNWIVPNEAQDTNGNEDQDA